MSKDIKTRDIIKDIKSIDKAAIAGECIRNITAKTKERMEESQESQYDSPHDYATSKVLAKGKHFANKSVIEAKIQTQKGYRYVKEKRRRTEERKTESNEIPSSSVYVETTPNVENTTSKIKTKEPVQKDIKTTDRKAKKDLKDNRKQSIKTAKKSDKTVKETSKASIKTSQNVAKQSAIKTAKVSKESYHAVKEAGRHSFSAIKKSVRGAKIAIEATRTTIVFLSTVGWVAILIIILIALIGGIFMSGSSNRGEGTQLSDEVIAHTMVIQKYAEEYEIPHFVNVLQAVMMQESGGRGNDPMQSSECPFNKKYPNTPNGITNPEYSIQVGVQNFADCLKQANCTDPVDIPSLSLALQGYNFGNGYISWALKNFGAYSQGNAKVFSDEQARTHGWSSYGDSEYVPHVMRYYQFAGLGTSDSKLVNIASSQIGNEGGMPYWSWYGYNERVEWCACFVSWVAYQSGDLDITIPKFAAVVDGVKWYKDRGQWKDRSYTPHAGDIIFFDWKNDGIPDHVGIVEKMENRIVYTIEGNSNDQCRRNSYSVYSTLVLGYGTK